MNKKESTSFEIDTDLKKTVLKILVSASNRLDSETANFISDPSDAETVHKMRLEIRKMRSLSSFIKKIAKSGCYNSINGRLKLLNKSLAAIRDLDILVLNCRQYNKSGRLTGIMSTERTVLSNRLRKEMSNPDRGQKMLPIDWPAAIEWDNQAIHETTTSDYVKKELIVMLKRYLKLGKNTDFSVPNQLHKFRIAGKKIKNIMELFLPILDIKEQKLYRRLKKLLQLIGDIHDFTASRCILTELSKKDSGLSDEANELARYFKKIEKKKAKCLHADWHRAENTIKSVL